MSRNFCQACSFARFGVKTRKAIEHTCGKELSLSYGQQDRSTGNPFITKPQKKLQKAAGEKDSSMDEKG